MLLNLLKQLPVPSPLASRFSQFVAQAPALTLRSLNWAPEQTQQCMLTTLLSHVLMPNLQDKELAFLQNHWLQVNIKDVPFCFYLSVNNSDKLDVRKQLEVEADVCFSGDSQSMLQLMSRNIDPDTLFFQRKLLVTGDTELGLEIKNFLDDMDLQHLPKFVQTTLQRYNELLI